MKKNLFLLALAMLCLTSLEAFQITTTIDDFERASIISGQDVDGLSLGDLAVSGMVNSLGFVPVSLSDNMPPDQVPGAAANNKVLVFPVTIPLTSPLQTFAVYVQNFTNAAVDEWVPMDWSDEEGISLWIYGNNTGGSLFIDILDNRNPGSTTDDAERFSVEFTDDFDGWQLFEFPWNDFSRKEIGNGAPNDGLNLTEMYGFAFGILGTVDIGTTTYYIDDVSTYVTEETPAEPLPVMGNFTRIFLMLLLVIVGSVAIAFDWPIINFRDAY